MNHQREDSYPPIYTTTAPHPQKHLTSTKPLRHNAKLAQDALQFPPDAVGGQTQLPATQQQLHRRLLLFFGLYALLLVALYALYAAYYFCFHQQPTQIVETTSNRATHLFDSTTQLPQAEARQQQSPEDNERLENKLILLERYIELLSSEVQDLNGRLREREKCGCSISCTFNGTKFADGSSWQSQCDVCTCQSGKIMCVPQKCPTLSCDEPLLIPGQCCPTCLRSCKYNNSLMKHGKKFNAGRNKECRCYDGRIRCEMGQKVDSARSKGNPLQLNLNSTEAVNTHTTGSQKDKG